MKKCPRCNLNYMNDDDTLCKVCKSEVEPNKNYNDSNLERNEYIKAGDIFYFDKNYKLINYLTRSDLKTSFKATYKLTKSYYMWIIALDGKERRGWKDVKLRDGRIKENFVGDKNNPPSNLNLTFDYSYKAVFENNTGSYTFLGVFKLDVANSTIFERYYIKVSDTTTLYDY